jgi:hypothetical protein
MIDARVSRRRFLVGVGAASAIGVASVAAASPAIFTSYDELVAGGRSLAARSL